MTTDDGLLIFCFVAGVIVGAGIMHFYLSFKN
jgi:hypothetical protein